MTVIKNNMYSAVIKKLSVSFYKSPNDSIRIRKQWKEVKRGERTGDDWSKDETSGTTLPGHNVTSIKPSMGKVLKMSTRCDRMRQ